MRVTISSSLLDRIFAEAAASPEREICGLLLGREGGIEDVLSTRNVAADPARRFEVDPAALFAQARRERQGGAAMLGSYHSHPGGDAIPSACDAAAAEPGRLWLIVAGRRAAAWRAVPGGAVHGAFDPVILEIV